MNKPTIFFSHSSKDKEILTKLKDVFCEKTGGTVDVFLSSDGQSIPLGRNWVHKVQEALEHSSIMVIFITPNSLRSSWIYFEAGYAYSKGIRVVPVGFLGSDLTHLSPPLSLLQGFNILNKDGLDNLIALVNDVYSHKHISSFTADDYNNLLSFGDPTITHPLGEFLPIINEIHITATESDVLNCTTEEVLKKAAEELTNNKVKYREFDKRIESFGMTISTTDSQPLKPINIVLDPTLLDTTLPLVINILYKIRDKGIEGISIRFDFINSIIYMEGSHKLTAKLFGTGVSLGEGDAMIFNDLAFSVSHLISFRGRGHIKRGATYLLIAPQKGDIKVAEIKSLLDLLFTKKVLYEENEWISNGD